MWHVVSLNRLLTTVSSYTLLICFPAASYDAGESHLPAGACSTTGGLFQHVYNEETADLLTDMFLCESN